MERVRTPLAPRSANQPSRPEPQLTKRSSGPNFADLEEGLKFNKLALDEALERQAELFYQVAEKYAMAVSIRDANEQALKETWARVDSTVRNFHKDEKTTEKFIEGRVRLSEDYKNAFAEYSDAALEAGRLQALVEAYKQRSHALRDLSALHISRYYDGTDTKQIREKMNDQRKDYFAKQGGRN